MPEPTYVILYDVKQRRPACVLLQAATGGSQDALYRFFVSTRSWLTGFTRGMQLIRGTADEWRRAAALVPAETGAANAR